MMFFKPILVLSSALFFVQFSHAHFPYVAPLSYQTFNNHSAIVSGFYDNPFAAEVAIKHFKFYVHNPLGEKIEISDDHWSKTQSLSSYTLENKIEGTYRIRGLKQGTASRFVLDGKVWKALIGGQPALNKAISENVIYASQLSKKTKIKTVQTTEIIETFVSRKHTSNKVIEHLDAGFAIQFLSHPNAIQAAQPIQLRVLDDLKGIAGLNVEILAQTADFSRDRKVYQSVQTDAQGALNFMIKDKGQYLLKIDYQQPFTHKNDDLKRYKYTLSFNVI